MKKGKKYDENKTRWSLMPDREILQVLEVLEGGAKKYGVDNWQQVDDAKRRYIDALQRHWHAWKVGQKHDKESGLHHLAHVACNVLFLLWFDNQEHNKIYISGKMTGIENFNYYKFFEKEKELSKLGFDVVNPAYESLKLCHESKRWLKDVAKEEFMRNDLSILSGCDIIYMMTGWEDSPGAEEERERATELGLKIIYEESV
jgi:hypothetical protein